MADDILTIALDGDISLGDFAETMKRFRGLIDALTQEIGGKAKVDWRMDDLQVGSALATVRGNSPANEVPRRVVQAYGIVGNALQHNGVIPYSEKVRQRAYEIRELVKGSITSIRFETDETDAIIGSTRATQQSLEIRYSYGEVKGVVQTLTRRRGLRFTLYDLIFDKPISCYLTEDQEETMRGAWGRKAIVSGRIGRDPDSGRPLVVRDIRDVVLLDTVEPGSYRQARGAIPVDEGGPKPETVIRSMRDAW